MNLNGLMLQPRQGTEIILVGNTLSGLNGALLKIVIDRRSINVTQFTN